MKRLKNIKTFKKQCWGKQIKSISQSQKILVYKYETLVILKKKTKSSHLYEK